MKWHTLYSVCPNNSAHFCLLVGSFVISVEPRRLMTHSPGPLIHRSVQAFDTIPPPAASKQEGGSLVSYWLDFRLCALFDITHECRKQRVKDFQIVGCFWGDNVLFWILCLLHNLCGMRNRVISLSTKALYFRHIEYQSSSSYVYYEHLKDC